MRRDAKPVPCPPPRDPDTAPERVTVGDVVEAWRTALDTGCCVCGRSSNPDAPPHAQCQVLNRVSQLGTTAVWACEDHATHFPEWLLPIPEALELAHIVKTLGKTLQ